MTSEKLISQQSYELRTRLTHVHGPLKLLAHRMKTQLSPAEEMLLDMAIRNSEALVSQIKAIEKMGSRRRLKFFGNVRDPGEFFGCEQITITELEK